MSWGLGFGLDKWIKRASGIVYGIITDSLSLWTTGASTQSNAPDILDDLSPVATNLGDLRSGNMLSFDGVNDSVDLGVGGEIALTTNYTITYRFTESTTGKVSLSEDIGNYGYIQHDTLSSIRVRSDIANDITFATPLRVIGQTYTLTIVVDGSYGMRVWIDGVESVTGSQTISDWTVRYIAKYTSFFYAGKLGKLQIYNAAWTQAEIDYDIANPEKYVWQNSGSEDRITDLALFLWLNEGAGDYVHSLVRPYKLSGGLPVASGDTLKAYEITGATWSTGLSAPVPQLALMGWSKHIEYPNSSYNVPTVGFDGIEAYSAVCWFNYTETSGTYAALMSLPETVGGSTGLLIQIDAAGDIIVNHKPAGTTVTLNGGAVSAGLHCVIVSFSLGTGNFILYFDGVEVATGTSTALNAASEILNINCFSTSFARPIYGDILQAGLSKSPISPSLASDIYDAGPSVDIRTLGFNAYKYFISGINQNNLPVELVSNTTVSLVTGTWLLAPAIPNENGVLVDGWGGPHRPKYADASMNQEGTGYASIAPDTSLDVDGGDATISLLLKSNNLIATPNHLISSVPASVSAFFLGSLATTGNLYLYDGGSKQCSPARNVIDGVLNLIIVSLDQTGTLASFYVNGKLAGTVTFTTTTWATNLQKIIGGRPVGTSPNQTANLTSQHIMDEVMIYKDKALSLSEQENNFLALFQQNTEHHINGVSMIGVAQYFKFDDVKLNNYLYRVQGLLNNQQMALNTGIGTWFDGVNDRITYSTLTLTGDYTFAVWVTPDVIQGQMVASGSNNDAYIGHLNSNTDIRVRTSAGEAAAIFTPPMAMVAGQAYRLVIRRNGTSVTCHVNGVESSTGALTPVLANMTFERIGLRQNLTIPYEGTVADMQWWDQAWSTDDIEYDYLNSEKLVSERDGSAFVKADDMVFWDTLDGYGDVIARDLISGDIGTVTGAVIVEDLPGIRQISAAALKVDANYRGIGNGDYIQTSATDFNKLIYNVSDIWSFTGWVRVDDNSSPVIFGVNVATAMFFEFGLAGACHWRCGGALRNYQNVPWVEGKWHHVAVIKTGTGDSGKFYLDGVLQTDISSGAITTTVSRPSAKMIFGAYFNGTFGLKGRLKQVAIYNGTELSQANITAMAVSTGITPSSVVASPTMELEMFKDFVDTAAVPSIMVPTGNAAIVHEFYPAQHDGLVGRTKTIDVEDAVIMESGEIEPSEAVALATGIEFWITRHREVASDIIDIDGTDIVGIDEDGNIALTSLPSSLVYVNGEIAGQLEELNKDYLVTVIFGSYLSSVTPKLVGEGYQMGEIRYLS